MTLKFVADARGGLRKEILYEIARQSGGEVVLHFGHREDDFHGPSLQRMDTRKGRRGHLIADHLSRGANLPLLASPDYVKQLETAVEQMQRDSPPYRYRSHHLHHLNDYLDYYHILADGYAQQIEASGANCLMLINIPHLGYDMVLLQVAKALGLRTVILSQTFFKDSFFSCADVSDFGYFPLGEVSADPMPIEKGSAPDLFYMEDRWQETGPKGKIHGKAVLQLLRHLVSKSPGKLLNPGYVMGNLRRMSEIYGALPDWRDPFAKFFHTNELAYFEHLAEYEREPADLNADFVYIPLHNQPEMSTQSLGGLFRDQLLMIEAIASDLPDGWKIYVKENPRQNSYSRGPMFFHRLSRIKGVQFVPSETSTHVLSDKARLTATVTGTAGWEALRKGKPTVVFGGAWYRSFPGVHAWHPGMDLEAVANSTFSHEDLEQAAGELQERCHPGIIEPLFRDMVKDFDAEANKMLVAKSVAELLSGDRPFTYHRGA